MKTVNAFQTSDGSLFETKNLAEKHEVTVSKTPLIDEFLASEFNKYPTRQQSVIARNSIISWELWSEKHEVSK